MHRGKALLLGAALVFAGAQLVQPERTNPAVDSGRSILKAAQPPPAVVHILDRACFDCHSNQTRWPWYSNVVPISWLIANHVNAGRRNLNFSDWTKYNPEQQRMNLAEVCEAVQGGSMPMPQYVQLHPEAKLSAQDIDVLCGWEPGAATPSGPGGGYKSPDGPGPSRDASSHH